MLTGTPVINYPNEIAVLYNILRGYIKTWNFTLNMEKMKGTKLNIKTIREAFASEKILDYIDFHSSKELSITRNPFGFENKIKENEGYKGVYNRNETIDKEGKVILDERGVMSDEDFIARVIKILRKKLDIEVDSRNVNFTVNTALPDTLETFVNSFIDRDNGKLINEVKFKRRIIGLTSYFKSAQEELLPAYNRAINRHIVKIPMSDYQFQIYEEARHDERETEGKGGKGAAAKIDVDGLFEKPKATYKIFSRLFCNFVMPNPPGRPTPGLLKAEVMDQWLAEYFKESKNKRENAVKENIKKYLDSLPPGYKENPENEPQLRILFDRYRYRFLKEQFDIVDLDTYLSEAYQLEMIEIEKRAKIRAEKQANPLTKAQEKALEKEAKALEKEAKALEKAQEKEQNDKIKEQERLAKEQEKALEKEAKALAKAEEKEAKALAKAEEKEAKALAKAEEKEEKERLKADKKKGKGISDSSSDSESDSDSSSDSSSDSESESKSKISSYLAKEGGGPNDKKKKGETSAAAAAVAAPSKKAVIDLDELFLEEDEDNERKQSVIIEGYKDEDALDRTIDELEGDEVLERAAKDASYKRSIAEALDFLKRYKQKYLSLDALRKYSPKFLTMIENIEDPDHPGLHLVYSQFRSMEGIGIFALALEANGYAQFKIVRNSVGWDLVTSDEDMGKPHYALYTGTEDSEEREIIRNIFNGDWKYIPNNIAAKLRTISSNNNMGEIIKVLMITSAGSEGINLRNTRYVHIMEPYWHPVRLEQVIGRARRICSHQGLPPELRTVDVFIYLMTLTQDQIDGEFGIELKLKDRSNIAPFLCQTSDEKLFEISTIKENLTDQILKAIKSSSIDCITHTKSNMKEGIVCLSFGNHPPNTKFSYNPNLAQDQNDTIADINMQLNNWDVKEILIESTGKKYMLRIDNNELYDYESIIQAKQIPGIEPILLGKLVKNEAGQYQIVKNKI
jgi:flagellar biosynthesis GTPase FlhF